MMDEEGKRWRGEEVNWQALSLVQIEILRTK